MFVKTSFTKENVDYFLKELAKEFRKRNGSKTPAEIILIGGASILVNYGFRDMTYDIDAVILASSAMKEAINAVGDKLALPTGWLNSDFQKTDSYSPKIVQYSKYYKTFSHILTIRTIKAEYLIAMKLVSGRRYKKDLSDIVGILAEQEKNGEPVNYEMIDHAMVDLYGNWDKVSDYAKQTLQIALNTPDLSKLYEEQLLEEMEAKDAIISVQNENKEKITTQNVNDVIRMALEKRNTSNQQ